MNKNEQIKPHNFESILTTSEALSSYLVALVVLPSLLIWSSIRIISVKKHFNGPYFFNAISWILHSEFYKKIINYRKILFNKAAHLTLNPIFTSFRAINLRHFFNKFHNFWRINWQFRLFTSCIIFLGFDQSINILPKNRHFQKHI